jgi:iron complex outermembrane receptor protein
MKNTPLYLVISAALIQSPFALAYSNDAAKIEKIEIVGRAQQFYLDSKTSIGTKTDSDILDIPLSAQVLSKQLIIDQAARDITDLYRSIAGVSEFSYSGVTFRGFRDSSNVFYDGVRGDPFSGFSVPQVFNVERVEILKGPAAAIYGGGEPGGMINYVTKKPTFNESKEVKLTLGNFSTAGASVDLSGGLTEAIAYRFGAFYERQDSFRKNADMENTEVAGGLLFNLGDNTTLTTTFDYIVQDLGGHRLRGVPVDDEGNFIVDRSYNANEEFDYQDLEALVLQANLQHDFSDKLSMNATVRYMDNEREQAYHESRSWVDVNGDGVANIDDQTIRREYRDQFRANEELSVTLDFVYDTELAGLEHQMLFGGDFHDVQTEYDYLRARYEGDGVANLNIFTLNYGITDPSTYNLQDLNRDGTDRTRNSFYLQDSIKFDEHWGLMLGARFDQFEELNKENDNQYDDSDVSVRAGLTYKPDSDSTLYINYSESFNPVSANDFENGADQLEPTTGNQIEVGAKKSWFDDAILTTIAFYQIDKENLVFSNPDYVDDIETPNQPRVINFGLIESEGLEFTLVGDVTDNISLTANYAYNETDIINGVTNTDSATGEFVNAPKHQAGIWARYNIKGIDSSLAFGVDYVSEQVSFNDQRVKPYTIFDASWTTQINEQTLLSVNINNLFDKEYAVSGFSERNGHFPGDPREIVVQLTYNF